MLTQRPEGLLKTEAGAVAGVLLEVVDSSGTSCLVTQQYVLGYLNSVHKRCSLLRFLCLPACQPLHPMKSRSEEGAAEARPGSQAPLSSIWALADTNPFLELVGADIMTRHVSLASSQTASRWVSCTLSCRCGRCLELNSPSQPECHSLSSLLPDGIYCRVATQEV